MIQTYVTSTENGTQRQAINTSIKSMYNMLENYKEGETEQGYADFKYNGPLSGGYSTELDKKPLVKTPVMGFIEGLCFYLGDIGTDGRFSIAIGTLNSEEESESYEVISENTVAFTDQETVPDDTDVTKDKGYTWQQSTSAAGVVRKTKRHTDEETMVVNVVTGTHEHEDEESGEIWYTYDYDQTTKIVNYYTDVSTVDYSGATVQINMRYKI